MQIKIPARKFIEECQMGWHGQAYSHARGIRISRSHGHRSTAAHATHLLVFVLATAVFPALALAQQPAANWVNISDPIVKPITDAGKKIGYPGQTAGVAVDPKTGDVYMIVPDHGIWKSSDRGATFMRADNGEIGGRCETAYSLNVDPAGGGRLACFMLDGKCAMTLDGGKTWQPFKGVGRNWDYAAVDWSQAEPKAIFAARHESGGEMYTSNDGGKSWKQIGKEPKLDKLGALGIFDEKTLAMTKGEGVLRSTDGGATWEKVSDLQPVGRVMRIYKNVAYWVGKDALLVSTDQGKTWQRQGGTVEAAWGPFFGEDEKHIMVASKKGFIETRDGGKMWSPAVPLPVVKGFDAPMPGWFVNLGWDPKADVFYTSKMGMATYRLQRQ
jgi:photosystem II stability/assembly factor-like uncharacterized protein